MDSIPTHKPHDKYPSALVETQKLTSKDVQGWTGFLEYINQLGVGALGKNLPGDWGDKLQRIGDNPNMLMWTSSPKRMENRYLKDIAVFEDDVRSNKNTPNSLTLGFTHENGNTYFHYYLVEDGFALIMRMDLAVNKPKSVSIDSPLTLHELALETYNKVKNSISDDKRLLIVVDQINKSSNKAVVVPNKNHPSYGQVEEASSIPVLAIKGMGTLLK